MKLKQFLVGGLAALLLAIGFSGCPSPVLPSHSNPPNPTETSQPSNTPGTNNPSPKPSPTETKTGTTDSSGQITFTDNLTLEKVLISAVDLQGSPLQNMKTTYWSGDGFRVYLIEDPSGKYLPSMGIYAHNSEHIIKTGKMGDSFYKIATVDENSTTIGNVVETWKSKNGMNFSTENYFKTINYDEYLKIKNRAGEVLDLVWKGIEMFTGVSLPKTPSEIINQLMPERKNPPQRWDVYTYNDGEGQSAILTMIPSNIPTVSIDTPTISGSEVKLSWWGADKDTYDQLTFLPDKRDLTKYVDGNTTSNLEYSFQITKDGNVYGGHSWTPYSPKTSATVTIPDPGNYTLEMRVKDEVDNIGNSFRGFSVATSPTTKTIDLQPGPEGKDATIYHILWPDRDNTYEGDGNSVSAEVFFQSEGGPYWDKRFVTQSQLSSIPPGATINSAVLKLYGSSYSNYTDSTPTVTLYKLNSSWDESTIKWDTGLNPQKYSSTNFSKEYTSYWHNFNITSLVQDWVKNGGNFGIELSTGDQGYFKFFTSDYTIDKSLRPKLEITYTTP